MKDRFLLGIFIGIGVLVVTALILFFIRQGQSSYGDESTPAGVLQNYFLAIQKHDYERAYGYVAEQPGKPSLDLFRQSFLTYSDQGATISNTPVEINDTILDEQKQTAVIQVTMLHSGQDLFGTGYRTNDTATLALKNGAWKITRAPYPYWPLDLPVEPPAKLPAPTLSPAPTSAAP